MKSILISAVTASYGVVIFVLVAAKAQNIPFVFESLWMLSTRVTYDPLLVAAAMLTTILVCGRTLDFVRNLQERRSQLAMLT